MTIKLTDTSALSKLLDIILAHLPLHAEEGGRRDRIAERDLIIALSEDGISMESATLLVAMIRRQLDALALFDRVELSDGAWAFVSFPASLVGRSLLETLAVSNQSIVEPDYWDQGDHRPVSVKEEQRRLLHQIESTRVRLNPSARPVRVVHVAWAAIRLHNRFLLHRREDDYRPGEKTHVLPGGRFNPGDLPPEALSRTTDVLQQVFKVNSPLVDEHIDKTLVRELYEELGLHLGEHYSFKRWLRLPPYRQVNGAGNRHAYTEYDFHLYTLQLTSLGEVRLLDQEAQSSTLTWFSVDELAAPHRADGESAYVDVLHVAWGKQMARHLAEVSESGASAYAMTGVSETLDLPAGPDAGFQIGKPGKERTVPVQFDETDWQLLLLLGWHARGFAVNASKGIRLMGGGWVQVEDDEVVRILGAGLQSKTNKLLPGLIEIRDGRYLSLRISPEILMFSAGLL
jgi:8-oxo-dGTP pyrophosphatase MutT (NUDIX family)